MSKKTSEKILEENRILEKIQEFNNNGKITVAIFCDTYYPIIDGVINVLNNHAKHLNKMCNVVVFVPKHNYKTHESKDYLVVGVCSLYFKFVNYDLAFPKLDASLNKYIKKLRIDLIHSHTPFTMGEYASFIAKKRKIPIIGTFHSQYKKDFYKATKNNGITSLLMSMIMKVFNSYTETWTMHKSSLQTLIDYGYKGKYNLIPNATDFTYPKNSSQILETVNNKYNLANIENVFLFVGRLIEQKNIYFIVKVLRILKDNNIKFKMVFVGDGPDSCKLKKLIDELNLTEDIILTGKIMDKKILSGLYLRSDLFLFPSLYDVSSIVQIESACHKTPVAFVKDSVTSCTVTHDVNGFIFENNEEKYAEQVIDLIKNKAKLKEVSEQAYKDLYVTWEDVVRKMYERYLIVIEENMTKKS